MRSCCPNCKRPLNVCICGSLPAVRLSLPRDLPILEQIVIFQHPHEVRRSLRSIPALKGCFVQPPRGSPDTEKNDADGSDCPLDVLDEFHDIFREWEADTPNEAEADFIANVDIHPQDDSDSETDTEVCEDSTPGAVSPCDSGRLLSSADGMSPVTIVTRRPRLQDVIMHFPSVLRNEEGSFSPEDVDFSRLAVLYPSPSSISVGEWVSMVLSNRQLETSSVHSQSADPSTLSNGSTSGSDNSEPTTSATLQPKDRIGLIVLDGTWDETKCMMNDAGPWLNQAVKLHLSPSDIKRSSLGSKEGAGLLRAFAEIRHDCKRKLRGVRQSLAYEVVQQRGLEADDVDCETGETFDTRLATAEAVATVVELIALACKTPASSPATFLGLSVGRVLRFIADVQKAHEMARHSLRAVCLASR